MLLILLIAVTMNVFRVLNKVLGAMLLTLVFTPLIALVAISRVFNFLDLLFRGQIVQAFLSIIASPFTALATATIGIIILLHNGWTTGLLGLIKTFPVRTMHFFNKELSFGGKENESVNAFFVNSDMPSGLNEFVTPDFFGKLTLKLLSLCLSMEIYLSFYAKTVSPHNDVSIYFTKMNLSILKSKYSTTENEQSAQILMEINHYLAEKLEETNLKVKHVSKLTDDTRVGKLQSAQDELDAIKTAQRCVEYFTTNQLTDFELGSEFQCSTATVLNYIWLAINTECSNEQDMGALKEKLMWTLFQIQRGFNITNGGGGADMPECPTGAIGLLVRVICDEKAKMPNSEYTASDPSPANLSLALKTALDRPFTSSSDFIIKDLRRNYEDNPESYKQKQKDDIIKTWEITFSPLIDSGVLRKDILEGIIDAGIDSWEPPPEQEGVSPPGR